MTWRMLLGIGDGPTDDSLDLNDRVRYRVAYGSLQISPTDRERRTIEFIVHVRGTNANAVLNAQTEIQRKLWQAREGIGPHRSIPGVVLSLNLTSDEWAYADVLAGSVTVTPESTEQLDQYWLVGVVVQLECRRYFRGERVINALTQEDVASGTQLYLPSVAGTAPAIARMIVSDTSTNGQAINRVRVGVQGLSSGLYANDVTFTNPLTALEGVPTDGDGSDSHGEGYSTVTAQSEWQGVASLASPSVRTSGLYDLYLRWRDHATILGTPSNLAVQGGAIARIQGHGRSSQGAQVTSLTYTWSTEGGPRRPTEGNLLILAVTTRDVTVTASGWTLAGTIGTTRKVSLYYKIAGAEEPMDVTVTFSSPTLAMIHLSEWAGIDASSPLDVVSSGATGTGTTASTGTTATTAQANTLAFAAWAGEARFASPDGGYRESGGGWSDTLTFKGAYAVLDETGTQSATATLRSAAGWSGIIATFKGITPDAPSVTAGTYQVRVTALDSDGNESLASFPASTSFSIASAISARWTAPTVGTVAQYRVYWNGGSGWNYVDTGSAATNHAIVSDTPDGTADPPVSSSLRSQVRAMIGAGTGRVLRPTAARESQIANGEWELTYLDTVQLPPVAALEDDEERDWTVAIQVRNDALTPDVDLDALILRPHNACAIDAEYVDADGVHLSLDSPHDWTLDTRRDGRTSVVLSTSGDDAAGAMQSGAFLVWPGDNAVLVLLDSVGGVNELVSTKATVRIDYTPRWDWLPGQDWGD